MPNLSSIRTSHYSYFSGPPTPRWRTPHRILRSQKHKRVRPVHSGRRHPRGCEHATTDGEGAQESTSTTSREDGHLRRRTGHEGEAPGPAGRVHVTKGITDGHVVGPRGDQEGAEAVQELQAVRGLEEVRGELFLQRRGRL